MAGIYQIANLETGMVYIGQSLRPKKAYQDGRLVNIEAAQKAASDPDVRERARKTLTATWAKRKEKKK